ncbi:MAG: PAC2 family protein [Actinobacteria bacterium]|nr:PAC2 family protein [Actinomycetota bacterium]MBW3647600.1 PAC2 family protein [Actinomycetota bacterium]
MSRDPSELFVLEPDLPDLGSPVLIQALDGFVDAGSAKRLAREHLLSSYDSRVVATFDVDTLLDYRARRPLMTFDIDHWSDYADPLLAVHLLHDADGTPFLVLAGPEPDVQWEAFIAAVRLLVEQLDVRMTVGLNAIPMAVPHTRPLGIISHASRSELVAGNERWVGTVQVPSSAGHLLEYRLGQAGHDAAGFAVTVPHYLSDTGYPAASLALLQSVTELTGLALSTDSLEESARQVAAEIDKQVGASEEVVTVVQALEVQYDAYLASAKRSLLAEMGGSLPTADELGAELEKFLAQQAEDGS